MLKVKLGGALRQIAGGSELLIPLPPSHRLDDVLAQLEREHPGILGTAADFQWRHGSTHVIVAVNGKIVEEGTADLQLHDGDQLSLLPPLGGGSWIVAAQVSDSRLRVQGQGSEWTSS